VIAEHGDELAQAFVELMDEETVERDAVVEQPQEGRPVHHRKPRRTDGDEVVLALLVLEQGAFAEPSARRHAGEGDGLTGVRYRADLDEAADDSGPAVEAVPLMADVLALREAALDNALRRPLTLGGGKIVRPARNGEKMLCRDQDTVRGRVAGTL